ncbi:Vegetative incompatibility protein HET-E-1 [Trametes pubescens]|uniref:Vegetative incompatibility protein HET-E-1 n=1 Tax=Trametes pubescens TaxID=154538 RepID=A0A1M2VR71_TRAPU|nr:Vegetative incompatibility protein HET-E-1 [Trametes pubescens]
MPRFLDTSTGKFIWIADPSTVIYAILSHTWRTDDEGGEQTYDDVRKLWKRVENGQWVWEQVFYSRPTSILTHPDLSDKIKGFCRAAREAGYKLAWIDTCCIDKSSSAELAEAINSMFDLYRLADRCYVYLADVPDREVDSGYSGMSAFARSRWHTRGWTLQELIAPKDVMFFTASWTLLGTKTSLVSTLSDVTGIDVGILTGRTPLTSVSVARRMSWAASRESTRIEDEAYSLLGIFGVHLSPIYGEGRNAFLRFQEEIIKTTPDQSIFAWGARCKLLSLDSAARLPSSTPGHSAPTGLFASSAREFLSARDVRPVSPAAFLSLISGGTKQSGAAAQSPKVPSLHSVVTPEGVRIKLLTIDLAELPSVAASIISTSINGGQLPATEYAHCLSLGRAHSLAILRCTDRDDRLVTLALFHPRSDGAGEQRGLPIATHLKCKDSCPGSSLYRVVSLEGSALDAVRKHLALSPVELYLLHHSATSEPTTLDPQNSLVHYTGIDLWPDSRSRRGDYRRGGSVSFRLAPLCEEKLRLLGIAVSPLVSRRSESRSEIVARTSIFASRSDASTEFQGPEAYVQITLTCTLIEPEPDPDPEEDLARQLQLCDWQPFQAGEMNTRFQFHVARVLPGHPSTEQDRDPEDTHATTTHICRCAPCAGRRSCESKPCRLDGEGEDSILSHTSVVEDAIRLPERVVAQAEFTIPGLFYSGSECSRILRLAVECPVEQCLPGARFIDELWLAIDLSGPLSNTALS